jgi:hypothetical protein
LDEVVLAEKAAYFSVDLSLVVMTVLQAGNCPEREKSGQESLNEKQSGKKVKQTSQCGQERMAEQVVRWQRRTDSRPWGDH